MVRRVARARGSLGSAMWDGESAPVVSPEVPAEIDLSSPEEIAGALAEFMAALRTGVAPSGEVRSNTMSLAEVEAAARVAETGDHVTIADVLADGYPEALADEQRADVAARLGVCRCLARLMATSAYTVSRSAGTQG